MTKILPLLLFVMWFWYWPERNLRTFSSYWLCEVGNDYFAQQIDFNQDGYINFIDYSYLVQE